MEVNNGYKDGSLISLTCDSDAEELASSAAHWINLHLCSPCPILKLKIFNSTHLNLEFNFNPLIFQMFREGNESNVFNMHLPELKDAHGVNLPDSPRAYSLHSINNERGFMRWDYDEATK